MLSVDMQLSWIQAAQVRRGLAPWRPANFKVCILLDIALQLISSQQSYPYRFALCWSCHRLYNGRYTLREQQSERVSKLIRQPSAKKAFREAYLQLWLYAIKYSPKISGYNLRKDLLKIKPTISQVEYIQQNSITNLAKEYRFENIVEVYPTIANTDYRIAEDILASARPSLKFRISIEKSSSYIQQLVDIIRSVEDRDYTEISTLAPYLSSDSREYGFDISSLCSISYKQSF